MNNNGKQQFEEFVKSGAYSDKLIAEKNDKNAKAVLEGLLITSEDKRHVFKEHGMVAKFVAKEEREINHQELINDILAFIRSEALSQVITLNTNKLVDGGVKGLADEYLYKPTYYVKPTLNSFGKSFNLSVEEDFSKNNVDSIIRFLKFNGERKARLEADYKTIMKLFADMKGSSLKTEVGSISKIPNNPVWDIYSIEKYFGSEFLCEFGEVNLTKLRPFPNGKDRRL